ncbi:MAG: putative protein kinase UbiB [Fimbriimonadaceae bacterium]|nr:putative protein kinase UbiB [Fimbriimonadaceae bacterium]
MHTADNPTTIQRLERDGPRMREILGVAVRYGLTDYVSSLPIPGAKAVLETARDKELSDLPREVRLREALTELGPTFIKIGQMLSTRPDLIGIELAEELAKLQSATPPDPPEVVRRTLEAEFGVPQTDIFAEFDPEPLASASIAQVHLARLFSGEQVAVKVQKSGIQATIESDLSVLESLAELADKHSQNLRSWEPVRLVREFRRSITAELDFHRELENTDRFRHNFEEDESVRFPRTWPELSTTRVLTLELLVGIPGTDEDALRNSGVDLNEFSRNGAQVYLEMVFRDGFYHADPHPGNFMLLPGGVVGIVDCGMVGVIDEGLRDELESLVVALTDGDVDGLAGTLWGMSNGQPDSARGKLRDDLADLLSESHRSIDQMDIANVIRGLLDVFAKYRIRPRPGMTQLLRMLVLLNGTSEKLSPEFSIQALLEPYRDEAIKRRLNPSRLMQRFQRSIVEWDKFFQALPVELANVMRRVQSGDFRVALDHRHLDTVVNRLVLGILTASMVLGSSLLWSMKAPPLIGEVSVMGLVFFLSAAILGWVLYRAVRSSGKTVPRD